MAFVASLLSDGWCRISSSTALPRLLAVSPSTGSQPSLSIAISCTSTQLTINVTKISSTTHHHHHDLPRQPSGQRTRPPCAVERDALSGRGSCLSSGTSAYQRIISIIPMHMINRVNPRQVRGFDSVVYKLWLADALISSIKVSAALTWKQKQTDMAKSPG